MRKSIAIPAISLLAIALHIAVGWMATPFAATVGGFLEPKNGWIVGACGVAGSWSILVLYNVIVASSPVVEMGRVLGGIFGGLPGPVVFVASVAIGLVLGAVGGKLGTSLATLRDELITH